MICSYPIVVRTRHSTVLRLLFTLDLHVPSAPGIIDSGCQHGFVCARAPENSLRNRLDRDSTSREFLGPSNFSVISPSYPESPYYCILIVCRMYGEILARMRVRADNPVRCTATGTIRILVRTCIPVQVPGYLLLPTR